MSFFGGGSKPAPPQIIQAPPPAPVIREIYAPPPLPAPIQMPPPPAVEDEGANERQARQDKLERQRRGRNSTILTGALGDESSAPVTRPQLGRPGT